MFHHSFGGNLHNKVEEAIISLQRLSLSVFKQSDLAGYQPSHTPIDSMIARWAEVRMMQRPLSLVTLLASRSIVRID